MRCHRATRTRGGMDPGQVGQCTFHTLSKECENALASWAAHRDHIGLRRLSSGVHPERAAMLGRPPAALDALDAVHE